MAPPTAIPSIRRREVLKSAGALGGAAVLAHLFPPAVAEAFSQATPAVDPLVAMRGQMAAMAIETTKLTNLITMFSGPGGNVLVRDGQDGKIVVDTFVSGAFAGLKRRIDAIAPPGGTGRDIGNAPVLYVINTHWHFDHTDNNERFRQAGAEIVAHENARRRLTESHELLGMHVPPVPAAALPTQTFQHVHHLKDETPAAEEYVDIGYLGPAHTDGDVYVRFSLGDVLHLGDVFNNGGYPFIDAGTGGNIGGMLVAVERALKMMNPATRIVPGHGPVGDRGALVKYLDMLTTVRDSVQRLKAAGRTEREVVAAKPTAALDATWGNGLITADVFVAIVYRTL